MKKKKEKIDLLFEKNAAEQLTSVDWNELNAAISSRLDKARQSRTSARKYPTVFKIAAGVTAAAAVVFIAVMVVTEKPVDLKLDDGRRAVVRFIDSKASASVEIKQALAKSQAIVDIGGSAREVAKGNVEIIDLDGDWKEADDKAAWIIISRPEPMFADNGVSRDMMNIIRLF